MLGLIWIQTRNFPEFKKTKQTTASCKLPYMRGSRKFFQRGSNFDNVFFRGGPTLTFFSVDE